MRVLCCGLLALSLSLSGAFAAEPAPLAAGQPSGIRDANLHSVGPLYILGGAVAVGVLLAVFVTNRTAYVLGSSSASPVTAATGTTTVVVSTTTTG